MTDRGFPVVEPPATPGERKPVSGVLLAAGTSSRFGARNKLLEEVDGEPIVRRAVRALTGADLLEVIAVVGYEADDVAAALEGVTVETVHNEAFEEGQAASVRRGLEAVDPSTEGVVFALGDMPAVRADTVDALVAAFSAGLGDPLVAACDGRRGNPVLFGRQYFDRLWAVEGDVGGREILLDSETTTLVETGDPGVVRDVDREEDLREFTG